MEDGRISAVKHQIDFSYKFATIPTFLKGHIDRGSALKRSSNFFCSLKNDFLYPPSQIAFGRSRVPRKISVKKFLALRKPTT